MKPRNAIAVMSDEGHLEKTRQLIYSAHTYGNWKGDYILLAHEIKNLEKLQWFISRGIKVIHTQLLRGYGLDPQNHVSIFYSKLHLFHP
ncbi:MAG: hypothetical protein H0X62_17585, partial [Bacteroidetes bacterium]|nr:hypothetical protein [Bacteroidota bacterium]